MPMLPYSGAFNVTEFGTSESCLFAKKLTGSQFTQRMRERRSICSPNVRGHEGPFRGPSVF